ncbi:gluconate 2-dehydrogenase subunit 3 family protein [Oceanobacillus polygoni]|uniref:Gluconate 2-dehydrogenase gamma chain n=1 Tax=Oceanobacillus polygoni TaxID=1235259 RepID=A0A9X0YU98_9BACI|nr:gluconate 2-dehydrogenase subunit 3 family protein [Oceanobacillus polygoni]MBP2078828.1 gluconate 2-dehydrogenase gamma chain [Oceanobacillus polygoni]
MEESEKYQLDEKGSSRRKFLRNSGVAAGGVVVGSVLGGLIGFGEKEPKETAINHEHAATPAANPNAALMFFTPDQYQTTIAATERIFPADDNGPGAADLNVAIYIDHQLASPWGINAKDYMLGAFYKAEATQQEQVRILRKDLFLLGLKGLDDYSAKKFDSKFTSLDAQQQDEVLTDFEKGEHKLSGVSSSIFFGLLRMLTIEGAYADPMYGGNKDMEGWAMRKFPGSRMNFNNEVVSKEFIELEPESLQSHMGH